MVRSLTILALCCLLGLPAHGQSTQCLFAQSGPAVVQILYDFDAGVDGQGNERGTGFIISASGHVLTNAHVVTPRVKGLNIKSETLMARVGSALAEPLPLSVVAVDEDNDLALLRLAPKPGGGSWPSLLLSKRSDLPVGAKLTALGFATSDLAIVPTAEKTAQTSLLDKQVKPWWQTSLSLNQGNSGGPVFGALGTVVGVAVAGHRNAQLIAWVIPINRADHLRDAVGVVPADYGSCAVFPECRSASHGIEGYAVDTVHEQQSAWRKGGYNQPAYCNDAIAELRKVRPNSNYEAVGSSEKKEEMKFPGGVLSAKFRYTCLVRERSGPIYNMQASVACVP